MEEEIDYFYQMFNKEYKKIFEQKATQKIALEKDENNQELLRMFPTIGWTKEERLEVCDTSLFYVCENYISLSDSKIEILPNNPFEFVTMILNKIEENPYNPYNKSFLESLNFIYQNYLYNLELGSQELSPYNKNLDDSYMEVTFDHEYKLLSLITVNMDLLEQTKTMTKFTIMQRNHLQGPLQKVKYRYRKDI